MLNNWNCVWQRFKHISERIHKKNGEHIKKWYWEYIYDYKYMLHLPLHSFINYLLNTYSYSKTFLVSGKIREVRSQVRTCSFRAVQATETEKKLTYSHKCYADSLKSNAMLRSNGKDSLVCITSKWLSLMWLVAFGT